MAAGGSVLETLYLLFDSEGEDKVEQGANRALSAHEKLEKKINSTDDASKKLGGSFLGMAKAAAAAIAAALSVGAVVSNVFETANISDKLDESSERLGIAVEDLSVWGDAVKMAGGTAAGFEGSIATLSASFTQLSTTGKSKAKPFFDELGISMKDSAGRVRDVMDVLPELAKEFEGMTKQESLGFGRKLGLDDGTIMLLQKGQKEVDALIKRQKELGVITKEDAEIAAKFKDSQEELGHSLRSIYVMIGSTILPAITRFIEVLTKGAIWMRENKHLVTGFFIGAATAITAYYLPAMLRAAAATIAATWPILAIIAVIALLSAAFALVYDDIMNFLEGNASVLGQLVEMWHNFVNALGDMLLGWRDTVVGIWDAVVEYIMGAINKITGGIRKALEYVGLAEDTTHEAVVKGEVMMRGMNATPMPARAEVLAGGMPRSMTKTTTTNIDKVEINTQATDADGIAQSFDRSLSRQLDQTANNADDGVAR